MKFRNPKFDTRYCAANLKDTEIRSLFNEASRFDRPDFVRRECQKALGHAYKLAAHLEPRYPAASSQYASRNRIAFWLNRDAGFVAESYTNSPKF